MAGLFDRAYAKISNALINSGKYIPTDGTRNQVGYSSTPVPVPESVRLAKQKASGYNSLMTKRTVGKVMK